MPKSFDELKDLLTPEAIKQHTGIDLDEIGTVQIYIEELKELGPEHGYSEDWTEADLFADFKAWYEDDYFDDSDPGLEALLDGSRVWPEGEGEDFDPTTEDMIDDWDDEE